MVPEIFENSTLVLAGQRFSSMDGTRWAGAFAFNTFFSLFPAIILLVTIASTFVDREQATANVISYVEEYVPITGEMQSYIFDTIAGVVQTRGQAGTVALVLLVWGALQCFITLISATNRAWDNSQYSWWRLPLKSLLLFSVIAIAVLAGTALPFVINLLGDRLTFFTGVRSLLLSKGRLLISPLIVFVCLCLLYKLTPRRPTQWREVLLGALVATLALRLGEMLFAIYLRDFARFNAIYGTFGGIMALLLWIYVSGCIFIYGACVCATQAEKTERQQADLSYN
jgi:YihY family inner membrane protein